MCIHTFIVRINAFILFVFSSQVPGRSPLHKNYWHVVSITRISSVFGRFEVPKIGAIVEYPTTLQLVGDLVYAANLQVV